MEDYLKHYGVKGMKWGIRRYQNKDGSLTDAGRKKYGVVNYDKKGKLKTHKDFVNANKYARADYLQRKDKITSDRKAGKSKFGQTISKNIANRYEYQRDLNKNRIDAGAKEVGRDIAKKTVKSAAIATGLTLGAVAAQKIAVGAMNRCMARQQGIELHELKNWYEYSIGKKEVAKYIAKAAGMGALYGAGTSTANYLSAVKRYNNTPKGVKKRMADRRKNWKVQKISRGGIGNYKEAAAQSNKETAENVLRYMKRYNSIAKLSKGK